MRCCDSCDVDNGPAGAVAPAARAPHTASMTTQTIDAAGEAFDEGAGGAFVALRGAKAFVTLCAAKATARIQPSAARVRGAALAGSLVFLVCFAAQAQSTLEPAATTSAPAQPTSNDGDVIARSIAFLAFTDDGARALLRETTTRFSVRTQHTITDTLVIVGADEKSELSLGGRGDDGAVCRESAEALVAMARDFELISVKVGMCAAATRPIVTLLKAPQQAPLSQALGDAHRRVGFAGRTFVSRTGLIVVVGSDAFGLDRVGATTAKR